MIERDPFERIVAALYEAAFDHAAWSTTFGLIDEALGTHGSGMVVGDGDEAEDVRIFSMWQFYRGQRNRELEREYYEDYYPQDERVPRIRRAPDSRLLHTTELFTEEELKTSATFNEVLARGHGQNGIHVRLDGPNRSRIVWVVNDPVDEGGWSSGRLDTIRRLLPHIRQCVRVRQALAGAGALGATLTDLLESTGLGIVQLDGRGRIVEANDCALDLLRTGDGLCDKGGCLFAITPEVDDDLQWLLARALPPVGEPGAGGSMLMKRSSDLPRLMLHVIPARPHEADFRSGPVEAFVVVIDPQRRLDIDLDVVEVALGLTEMEGQVALLLAQGLTVREVAAATERRESTIRSHVKRVFTKHGLSRQADLVRLVLSLAGAPRSGP